MIETRVKAKGAMDVRVHASLSPPHPSNSTSTPLFISQHGF